jgi:3-hydroxybutyryl-CoA dehydrogenase
LQNFPSTNKPIFAKNQEMKIVIFCDNRQKEEILAIPPDDKTDLIFAESFPGIESAAGKDAFFVLSDVGSFNLDVFQNKPVFIGSIIEPLSALRLSENVSRINSWPTFLSRPLWEVASNSENNISAIFASLHREAVVVKDEPGFVSARVLSMIINEAFYALEEKISTMEEIDMAMKLGTNYPSGPFEWAEKIGIRKIYLLLKKLALKEARYTPSPALKKLYEQIKDKE